MGRQSVARASRLTGNGNRTGLDCLRIKRFTGVSRVLRSLCVAGLSWIAAPGSTHSTCIGVFRYCYLTVSVQVTIYKVSNILMESTRTVIEHRIMETAPQFDWILSQSDLEDQLVVVSHWERSTSFPLTRLFAQVLQWRNPSNSDMGFNWPAKANSASFLSTESSYCISFFNLVLGKTALSFLHLADCEVDTFATT